jgi:2,3-bisphosphoglycerate-dependent phosphoglycerate mutase
MMTTRLLIARHGNTFGPGETPRRVGITDLPLVESGVQQGSRLGTYLLQHQLIPDLVFTSELNRTIQTAEAAQKAMETNRPTASLSIFNEIDYGLDENQPDEKVIARLGKKAIADWDRDGIVPNGWRVNPTEMIENWQAFANKLVQYHANQTCLVITSNGVARFAPHLTGDFQAFSQQHEIKLSTGAFSQFEYDPTTHLWHCLYWNIKPS